MDKKIIGNFVGTTMPQTVVDKHLDINSSNAIANSAVAHYIFDFESQLEGYGQQFDDHEERISNNAKQIENLANLIEENILPNGDEVLY